MKYCVKCGAQLRDESKFCTSCGAANAVPQTTPTAPTIPEIEIPVKQKKKGSIKRKIITVLTLLVVFAALGTIGYFVLEWYNSPEQQSIRAIDQGDYEAVLEILEDDRSISGSEKLTQQLEKRLTGIRDDFTNGNMDYSAARIELESIGKLNIKEIADSLEDVRGYVNRLNQSRTDYATAESLFSRGDYPGSIIYYKKVQEIDANYETAKQKINEAVDMYRQKALAKAADYAAQGDYADAVLSLNAALMVIPEDAKLSEQMALYEKDLAEQKKTDALNLAASYAEQGDYISAMNTLSKLMESQSTDVDLNVAYNNYCGKYVEAVLAEAERKVSAGYPSAMEVLRQGLNIVKNNTQLESRLESYENAYVAQVIAEADTLTAAKKYDEAISAVKAAQKYVPGNSTLSAKITEIEDIKPKNFLSVCKPYETSNYDEYYNGKTFNMVGNARTNGFALTYKRGYAYFNLGGNYRQLEFDLGHVDGSAMDDTIINIYCDGVLAKVITIKPDGMPAHYVIDVTGVQQIKFTRNNDSYGAQTGFADMMIQ